MTLGRQVGEGGGQQGRPTPMGVRRSLNPTGFSGPRAPGLWNLPGCSFLPGGLWPLDSLPWM